MTRGLQRRGFWIVTVAALAMAALTFSLGQWQLGRAAQKEALQAALEARNDLAALDGRALVDTKNPQDVLHRRVLLSGHWQAEHTVYLDNRPMNERPGFWVLTPLQIEGTTQSVLVQRGWIPRDFQDRARLASISTPTDRVQVEGRMALGPAKLYAFEGSDTGRIRQNLDITGFAAETGLPLVNALVIQTEPASDGLKRDWAPANMGVDKHYGYAFQWFGLCALVVGLYLWFQLIQPRRAKPAAHD